MSKFNIRDHIDADAFVFLSDLEEAAENMRMNPMPDVVSRLGGWTDEQYRDYLIHSGINPDAHTVPGYVAWSSRAECRLAGCCLDLVDRGYCGPDSGCMDHECLNCGRYYSHPLY